MNKLKVAIIGAGPSGFAVAEVLNSKEFSPYFDFTIYERNDYVGGKCCTIFEDGTVCNDKPGGYEMGAVMMSKYAASYADLKDIVDRHGIKTIPHAEKNRAMSQHFTNGKKSQVHLLYWSQLFTKPRAFYNSFRGIDEYATDYLRYSRSKHAGYTNRPSALYKSMSKKYSKSVYKRLSTIMQGFGYADLDDRHLTPAVLYYNQYIEPESAALPLHKLENGMQGIWAKIAQTYKPGAIRLNQSVEHVHRSPHKVTIKTKTGSEDYDYLVVATPLKPALEFLDLQHSERRFLSKMRHNHYVTVLCKVRDITTTSVFNIPGCTDNKRLGEVVCGYKRYPNSDYVAAYLYVKKGSKHDDETILKRVEKSLNKDFGTSIIDRDKSIIKHWTDYFGHLGTNDLKNGWYEKFDRDFQGRDRTLYVSSGLHMETVGASVQFGTREAKKYAKLWLNQPR